MTFARLAWYFQKLEETASRNLMTEVLADLFKEAEPEEIDKICYLAQGRVVPLFVPLEFGMADKMVIKAISRGFGAEETEVVRIFREEGDLGKTAERLFGLRSACRLSESSDASVPAPRTKNGAGLGIRPEPVGSGSNEDIASRQASPPCLSRALSVAEVFEILNKVAHSSGGGSVEQKIGLLGDLFNAVDSLSARYLARIPLGKLRLGFSDMTILDALSWMLGEGKRVRPLIEKAYNVRPDLGFIARAIKLGGVGEVGEIGPKPGTPILMARAERLSSGQEIIEKIGKCAVEPKIDGFRVAVHFQKSRLHPVRRDFGGQAKVTLFSRNMENTTAMFPDIIKGVEKQIMANEAIFEGEAIAYNPQTGEFLPFQETVQRKRKYDIEQMAQSVPLKLICFDCLYVDGKNLIHEGYLERRKYLENIIKTGETLIVNEMKIVDDPQELEKMFQDAISRGLEGIFAKRLDGVYQAGARGWNWIKYKRSYQGKLEDTIDAVVMGYDYGQGKRAGFGIGDFLIGVYDQKTDTFKTIAKIGTGLTDEEWRNLKVQSSKFKVQSKPARYDADKGMECNVWVAPAMVVVIRADEITRSPVHTAGRVGNNPGFALRFPRLIDFRDDKAPEDATSVKEIEEMYQLQGKKKVETA